jgi:archaellin
LFYRLRRQNGISGMALAMILMLFVAVAAGIIGSILYTGSNAGKYASTHIDAAMSGVNGALYLRDNIMALNSTLNDNNSIGSIKITVGNSGEPFDLTPPYIIDENRAIVPDPSAAPVLHIVYCDDENGFISDCAWTVSFFNSAHERNLLGSGEKAIITVWLHQWDGSQWENGETPYLGEHHVDQYHYFSLQLKPGEGIVLDLELTTPEALKPVNYLY